MSLSEPVGGAPSAPMDAASATALRSQRSATSREPPERVFCPHCNVPLADHHVTSVAARCEACRLLIGAGRALSAPPAGRVGGIGGASGRLANAAQRENAEPVARAVVETALRQVADHLGVATERLRLFDYEQVQQANETLPRVAVVMATSGSWKRAREAAASRRDGEPAGPVSAPRSAA